MNGNLIIVLLSSIMFFANLFLVYESICEMSYRSVFVYSIFGIYFGYTAVFKWIEYRRNMRNGEEKNE